MRQIIDLFAGLGGFSLAAHWNGIEPAAQVEINPHCRAFLAKAWPGVQQHGDIRTFGARPYRGIWAVMGGPPCQPASRSGKQRGEADDRWLWGEAIRVVDEAQPTWFLFENPPGILDVGLDGILADLEGLRYEVQPISIPACAVDSPQDRERIWIIGYLEESVSTRHSRQGDIIQHSQTPRNGKANLVGDAVEGSKNEPLASSISRPSDGPSDQPQRGPEGRATVGRDAENGTVVDSASTRQTPANRCADPAAVEGRVASRLRQPERSLSWGDYEWLACPDPKRGTVLRRAPVGLYDLADGVSPKLLEALGNSIVPQVAAEIIRAMIQSEP